MSIHELHLSSEVLHLGENDGQRLRLEDALRLRLPGRGLRCTGDSLLPLDFSIENSDVEIVEGIEQEEDQVRIIFESDFLHRRDVVEDAVTADCDVVHLDPVMRVGLVQETLEQRRHRRLNRDSRADCEGVANRNDSNRIGWLIGAVFPCCAESTRIGLDGHAVHYGADVGAHDAVPTADWIEKKQMCRGGRNHDADRNFRHSKGHRETERDGKESKEPENDGTQGG